MHYQRLLNYAEWYYTKYFPSQAALYEKLLLKGDSKEIVEQVMTAMKSMIVEDKVIESRIREYISQGKTERYIRLKLRQKKFDVILINEQLNAQSEILNNPDTYRVQIEKTIQRAMQK